MYLPHWGAEVTTGNQKIDDGHREIFLKIDNLMAAMNLSREEEVIRETLDYFVRYTREHFQEEEALHRECHAPDYEAHVSAHRKISRDIEEIRQMYENEGLTPRMEFHLVNQVLRGIVDQIHGYDLPLARFLQENGL